MSTSKSNHGESTGRLPSALCSGKLCFLCGNNQPLDALENLRKQQKIGFLFLNALLCIDKSHHPQLILV